jgi:hypothetical protein
MAFWENAVEAAATESLTSKDFYEAFERLRTMDMMMRDAAAKALFVGGPWDGEERFVEGSHDYMLAPMPRFHGFTYGESILPREHRAGVYKRDEDDPDLMLWQGDPE